MIRLLFLVNLLAVAVIAQDANKTIRIRPFGGLNTIADDFSMPLEDARIAHNIDFSANIGGITVRKGYDSVSAVPSANWDSLVSVYGAYYSDGSQQLFVVADVVNQGWGSVLYGERGSSSLLSPAVALTYWPIQQKTKFAMMNDLLFAVNGQSAGMVWNKRVARRWPLSAPGQPTVCPLAYSGVSSYKLNGEYRYVIAPYRYYDGGVAVLYGASLRKGAITPPIKVTNGRVLLTDFTYPVSDSIAPSIDSVSYQIYRTKANSSPIDDADSLYLVPNSTIISIGQSMATFHYSGDTEPYTYFIDSIPDNLLSASSPVELVIDKERIGRGNPSYTEHVSTGRRYASPMYLSKTDTTGAPKSNNTTHSTGLCLGVPAGTFVAGWAWVVSAVDTSLQLESDTTRSLFVANQFTSTSGTASSTQPVAITIGLPKISSSMPGVMKNIYRALVYRHGYDTTQSFSQYTWSDYENHFGSRLEWVRFADSVYTGQYYLVATVSGADTSYTDRMRYDSLSMNRMYRSSNPGLFDNIFTFDGRLYAPYGTRLYFSMLDSATRFGAFNSVSVNDNDGDIITLAYASRGVLRVLKNRSNYNIFQGVDLGWNRTEVSGYFGCIAPNSHVATINGHYYVSDIGVIRETEGANLERTQSIDNVSAKLRQFADFSVETARRINAFAIPSEGKVLFSLPDGTTGVGTGDTTYVYDERTNTWATWDGVVFSDATLYGAETGASFVPCDTMYFIQPGSRTLWRYGSGSASTWVWESAPIGIESPAVKQVNYLGVWGNNLSSLFGIQGTFKDETGTNVTTPPVELGTLIDGYKRFSFPPDISSALYHRLRIVGSATGSLRAFDITQTEVGEMEEQ